MRQVALQGQVEGLITNLLSPYVREEGLEAQNIRVLQTTVPERKAAGRDDPSLSRLFREASGHWRVVCHDGDWWAVGHHFVYPARDRDHAERRCQELSNAYLES